MCFYLHYFSIYCYGGAICIKRYTDMSEKIKSFFEQKLLIGQENELHAIELATAVLMIAMIHMDDDVSDSEHDAVFQTLKAQFDLDEQHTQELYTLAESELKHTTDYSPFTNLINQHISYKNKLRMIKLLWQIAYSDRQLHRDEAYFAQKIGDLLEVSQEDFDFCRDQVRNEVL